MQCIVAPYEADAQLAYLSKEGIIDTVITEDSDLLVFGSRRVLFKMDECGHGKLIEIKDLGKANKSLTVGRWFSSFEIFFTIPLLCEHRVLQKILSDKCASYLAVITFLRCQE